MSPLGSLLSNPALPPADGSDLNAALAWAEGTLSPPPTAGPVPPANGRALRRVASPQPADGPPGPGSLTETLGAASALATLYVESPPSPCRQVWQVWQVWQV
jgi:hypothetical protein